MVKLIAFDVWQTLADYPYNLYEDVLEMAKLPMTLQEFILNKGKAEVSSELSGRDRFIEKMKILGVKDEVTLEKISNLYLEAHSKIYLYKDTISTLEYLKNKGYSLALLTNVDNYAHEKVMKLFPKNIFDHVIASYEVGFKKPEKEIFLKLSNNYDLDLNEIVMVGDSELTDITPALKLGWKTVFINRKGIISKQANYSISSLTELTKIF